MAEDLNKLSSADIRRFEQTIAEAKALTARQEEIAKQVLATEREIGKVRLASLNQYFDAYSKGLDAIIARKTSELNDAFLVFEHKASDALKKFVSEPPVPKEDAGSATREANITKQADDGRTSIKVPVNIVSTIRSEDARAVADDIAKAIVSAQADSAAHYIGNGSGNVPPSTDAPGISSPGDGGRAVGQTADDTARAEMHKADEAAAEDIVARLSKFNEYYKTLEEKANAIANDELDAVIRKADLEAAQTDYHDKKAKEYENSEVALQQTLLALTMARLQTQEDKDAELRALQIKHQQEVANAELSAQQLKNNIEAQRRYAETPEAKAAEAQKVDATKREKGIKLLEEQRIKDLANAELKAKRKNNDELFKKEKERIDEKYALTEKNIEEAVKKQEELEAASKKKAKAAEAEKAIESVFSTPLSKENNLLDRIKTLDNLTKDETDERSAGAALAVAIKSISTTAQQLEKTVDEIAKSKGEVDTRLQGSNNETAFGGSYWDQMVKDMTSIGAITPYFKQEDFANNIRNLVKEGIAFDLEQRAFLMTIQSKIADTFSVADGTLLRLIRLQQEDSTAGRLGMESALTAFLNNMYENTEYLKQVASSVRNSLQEMEALMDGAGAAEVEYQVQKWLGSLYSVGMSDEAVNKISTALGQIASGQIEGLTSGGAGNLLIMAANDANIPITDILAKGLDASKTNELMQATVNYLAKIAKSTEDNNVVQQQLASVYGVKASDLKAATNLAVKDSIGDIYGNVMSYDNMLYRLFEMAGSMYERTSMAEMMTNVWENGKYSLAGSMASNPISYITNKVATLVDEMAGGIALPFVSALGTGVDLNTTVADLMRVAAVGTGILGSIGDIVSGLGNSFSGRRMLEQLGISSGSGLAVTPRGDGNNLFQTGGATQSVSNSGYVGNASSSDVKAATLQEAEDTKKQLMVEAQEEEEANQINVLNTTVLKIYELLDDVAHGSGYLNVKVSGYGLTTAGGGAQGGVSALSSGNSSNNEAISAGGLSNSSLSGSGSSLSGGGVNTGGISGSVSFSGWTTIM